MLTRRDWLKAVGGAAVAASAAAAPEGDLRAKAKRNVKLAIFTGPYAVLPLDEAVARIKADGFGGAVCEYAFKDVRFDPMKPDWSAAEKIRGALAKQGIEIVGLYGYYNVVHPNPVGRERGRQRMLFLLENWKRLGSPIVATETGTMNAQSEWVESPENQTEKGYAACKAELEALARAAEKSGAVVAIEPYWRNIIGSADRAERLFRDVASPSLKLIMDPCNYFRKEDLPKMQSTLEDIFQRVGSQTVLAHAKDVKASAEGTDLPAAGQGVLDYPLYLRLLAQLDRPLWLAVEHLSLPEVAKAREYVLSQFERI
jgi:sugar phosphate isomerase/epimerase